MKIRIKFTKHGAMKFIGHLDIMRYFQKAMRRAYIPIAYSEGFSPHQIMSFAAPLGVGIESNGEYMDIELKTAISSEQAVQSLNDAMAEGIVVKSFLHLPDEAKNAMSIVAAADYTLVPRNMELLPHDWEKKLLEFYHQPSIIVIKKTKKSEVEMDIKPFIYELSVQQGSIFLKLSSGSVTNIKPELVLQAFYQTQNMVFEQLAWNITREEMYTTNISNSFIPLDSLGAVI